MPWAAAVCVGLATWFAIHPVPDVRMAGLVGSVARRRRTIIDTRLATAVAVVGTLVALPLPWNIGLAVAMCIVVPKFARHIDSQQVKGNQEALARHLPMTIDLLAAAVSSGATIHAAVRAVSTCTPSPVKERLAQVEATLALGADPREAWGVWQDEPALRSVALSITRAMHTGAPLADVLSRLADDLRREHILEIEVASRRAGVRAVAPLAACFLPAFVLVGVVPFVASLAMGLIS